MGRANLLGLALSFVTAMLWAITAMEHWSIWPGIIASGITGLYWGFGRQALFPTEFTQSPQRRGR
ncbi:hypothetical protein [Rudaeicoccus suwonensis]|uniref:Uncharacterized protein n=1 Tax=Rudaeicoccus suwonensis TaxID=657409 RepID=A0A561E353_9MICO|nr:hypothetical protein [Rudaeicoccus suwonensis]TWE10036.1 hypothetical protein BKA23_2384 [Rudaeicoccus suwonensis]